jgi:hypothetical protein
MVASERLTNPPNANTAESAVSEIVPQPTPRPGAAAFADSGVVSLGGTLGWLYIVATIAVVAPESVPIFSLRSFAGFTLRLVDSVRDPTASLEV